MKNAIRQIRKPTLLIDKNRALKNIRWMAEKAKKSGVVFRPHFKTHQSAAVGEWFREAGVDKITVSSLDMARYFADNGWRDITVAFPVNIREMDDINDLAARIKLNLLVESAGVVAFLQENLKNRIPLWIKVDAGYHRTGISWDSHRRLKEIAEQIRSGEKTELAGVLTHAGHTYHAASRGEILIIFRETRERMQAAADLLRRFGFQNVRISVGDTPGCSLAEKFSGLDEVRPGNFVFYDVMQWQLGSCREEQIAAALACPVVAKHEERNELVIHGGAVHLSKESLVDDSGRKIFGYAVPLNENGWGEIDMNSYISALSQEHGIVSADEKFFKESNVGDLIAVLPVHSCLTVNLVKKMVTLEGAEIEVMKG